MSNHRGEVVLDWADGTHTFRLTMTTAMELEDKCDAAIAVIARRLMLGEWKINDVRETIRLGLIGGGAKPHDALRLVRSYVDDIERYPLSESAVIARTIAVGAVYGFQSSPLAVGEGTTETPNPPGSMPLASTKPPLFSGLEDLLETFPSGSGLPS